jgi:hypothetical protein
LTPRETSSRAGVFFVLLKGASWRESALHSFGQFDRGGFPLGDLTEDGAGHIYGNADNIYEMKHTSRTRWRYRQLLGLGRPVLWHDE